MSSVYEALQTASGQDKTPGKTNLFSLIRLLSTEPKSNQTILTLPSVLIVATALCHCWSSSESEQGLYIFAQNLVKVSHQLLTTNKTSRDLSFWTSSLERTINITLQTHKASCYILIHFISNALCNGFS